ncbi:hypothetical protein ACSLBF_00180 [Pseudoalteromonas sp. T1lg65]|uniref:hypothetical protein n=1 Tax=Pseudoalteromonas sp. T1lg65 TaxID=2077101 RepID=UPI003F7A1CEF
MKKSVLVAFSLACIIVLPACETSFSVPTKQQGTLQQYLSNKGCDASFQCRVIAVGYQPNCASPREYLVYSTKHNDEVKVESLAKSITDNEQRAGTIGSSACSTPVPVQSLCIENTCQPVPVYSK